MSGQPSEDPHRFLTYTVRQMHSRLKCWFSLVPSSPVRSDMLYTRLWCVCLTTQRRTMVPRDYRPGLNYHLLPTHSPCPPCSRGCRTHNARFVSHIRRERREYPTAPSFQPEILYDVLRVENDMGILRKRLGEFQVFEWIVRSQAAYP